jgi:putative transport protein
LPHDPTVPGNTGFLGDVLGFLGDQPFVLLFATLALGTMLGRRKLGFLTLGSTAGTLLVGLVISLGAYIGFGIRYEIPTLLTTVAMNLFMFAVGYQVGPQFFAGMRRDGGKFVTMSLIVVLMNFGIVFAGARALDLPPGIATGMISGSMTDTGVIGAATGAVETGAFNPPAGVTPAEVIGNAAAGYAIVYLFSLIGIILLVRYLPRLSGIDARAEAREAEASLGGGSKAKLPMTGHDAVDLMPRLGVDVRAYRLENARFAGRRVLEASAEADVPVLQLRRGGKVVDLSADPTLQVGDILTVVSDVERLVGRAEEQIGPEVADPEARHVELEVVDIVVTRKDLVGMPLEEALEKTRRDVFPGAERVGRLLQPVATIRAGEPLPAYPGTRLERGDILRVLGPRSRIASVAAHVGRVVRESTASDILTLALGLSIGYLVGYIHVPIGIFSIGLGTPAGVMIAGIAISTLRSRNPLFGGPISEGARTLLQDLGLDLFIAVVALNSAASVASAFARGGVWGILAVGIAAGLIPPVVVWILGRKLWRMNGALLLGAMCGARFSTPGLKVAQEETESAVPAVAYPVPKAVTAIIVLITGYLALFL